MPLSLDSLPKNPQNKRHARVAELADALDLGSSGITVGVQLPSLAPFFLTMIPLHSALFLGR
jgi:hypothetical protein